jgi:hypothetical protein
VTQACHARGRTFSLLVDAGNGHVELCLRARDRRTLTLDRKAVPLKIAGGEVAADAGQHFGHAPGRRGRIEHRPGHAVIAALKLNPGRRGPADCAIGRPV